MEMAGPQIETGATIRLMEEMADSQESAFGCGDEAASK